MPTLATYVIPTTGDEPSITVQIAEPTMKRDEIGTMRLVYPYQIEWVENGQTCIFDSNYHGEYIFTPFGQFDADSVLCSLAAFMGNCAETTDMEHHRMDGSCLDNFHMMAESIADYVEMYVWEFIEVNRDDED